MIAIATETLLLLELYSGGPGHGLGLAERILDRTMGGLRVPQGSLYQTLRELHRAGWVTRKVGAPEPRRGGKAKAIYTLTRTGVAQARVRKSLLRLLVA